MFREIILIKISQENESKIKSELKDPIKTNF